jgi:hypothetical protein
MIPGSTKSLYTRRSAVSRPTTPKGARSNSLSFSAGVWGAWSVAMQSSVPSTRPSTIAWRSPSQRSGGFILALALNFAAASAVNNR